MKQEENKRFVSKNKRFAKEKAQVYGEELERIRKQNGDILTPQIVLTSAENKASPLHEVFEWNDTIAGEKFRIILARQLINHIEVIITHNGTEEQQRAYINVTKVDEENDDKVERLYVTLHRALTEPKLREQTLTNAIREQEYWKEKYKAYKELSEIFIAIEKTKKKIKF